MSAGRRQRTRKSGWGKTEGRMNNDMRKYAVNEKSVKDFVRKYHVRDRRYQEEFDLLVRGNEEWIEKYGYTLFPAHISITGEMVAYFPSKEDKGPQKRRAG
jgi:hypothetical protein